MRKTKHIKKLEINDIFGSVTFKLVTFTYSTSEYELECCIKVSLNKNAQP